MLKRSVDDTPLMVAGRSFTSRLMVETGKYRDIDEMARTLETSGTQVVTFSARCTNFGQAPGEPNLLEVVSPDRYTLLPNTAGCYTQGPRCRQAEPSSRVAGCISG